MVQKIVLVLLVSGILAYLSSDVTAAVAKEKVPKKTDFESSISQLPKDERELIHQMYKMLDDAVRREDMEEKKEQMKLSKMYDSERNEERTDEDERRLRAECQGPNPPPACFLKK